MVVTPHLGASTREAQDKAGVAIAEQVVLALDGDLVPFAVNLPATEADEVVRPVRAPGRTVGPPLCRPRQRTAVGSGGRVPGRAGRPRHPAAHPGGAERAFSRWLRKSPFPT